MPSHFPHNAIRPEDEVGPSRAEEAAFIVSAAFLVVALLSFLEAMATLASLVSIVVHLSFGVGGVLSTRTFEAARRYLLGGGALYLGLLGVMMYLTRHAWFGSAPDSHVLNGIHLGLGVGMLIAGLCARDRSFR